MTNKRKFAVAATLATLAAATSGAAIAEQSDTAPTVQAALTAPATSPVTEVSPTLRASFKLFRTGAPAAVPPAVAQSSDRPNTFGRNARLARAIHTETGTGYVIPGDGFVCIMVPDPVDGWAESCVPVNVAAQTGIDVGLTAASGKTIETRLIPDGKTAVELAGPVSRQAPVATASSVRRRVRVATSGVVSLHTNAPGSLRVR